MLLFFQSLSWLFKYVWEWLGNYINWFSQDSWMNAFGLVPWTYKCSGSSVCFKPDLILQWEGIHCPHPCLEVQVLERCSKSDNHWKQAKKMWSSSAFSMLVVTNSILFLISFNLNFLANVPVETFIILCIPCQIQLTTHKWQNVWSPNPWKCFAPNITLASKWDHWS